MKLFEPSPEKQKTIFLMLRMGKGNILLWIKSSSHLYYMSDSQMLNGLGPAS